jgi:hypothetical protein
MPREGSGVIIVITPLPLASREQSRQEDSHSGRVRTLGKRVKGNLSRVQIPHPPLAYAKNLFAVVARLSIFGITRGK